MVELRVARTLRTASLEGRERREGRGAGRALGTGEISSGP